jgi:hypothetical protein
MKIFNEYIVIKYTFVRKHRPSEANIATRIINCFGSIVISHTTLKSLVISIVKFPIYKNKELV